jgi:phosphoserine aminotransferase
MTVQVKRGATTSFSFASAQACLPPAVLEELESDIRIWRGSGFSLLELPFSDREFEAIRSAAEQDLRDLLGLTSEHHVLFLQGGATALFALAPMNLLGAGGTADYVETGLWSRRALNAASPWGVAVAATGDGRSLPHPQSWRLSPNAVYCHVTSNETVEGLQFKTFPDLGGIPLVADMTSDFLTRPIPLGPFGLIYASAQKNLGIAGLTIVVVHEALLGRRGKNVPAPFDFALQAAARSKVNTPPTFAIAVAGKMLGWLRGAGSLQAAEARAVQRCASLYAAIDQDGFYSCPASRSDRSRISVRFHLAATSLDNMFAAEAEANGLLHLRGHPTVGGFRASLYNSVPQAAAETLADFMDDFRRRRG